MNYSLVEKKASRQKRNYVPDLDGHLSQCESNFYLMVRLIPELVDLHELKRDEQLQSLHWQFQSQSVQLTFTVTDIARYTTTLNLTVKTPKVEVMRSGVLIVRIYHDAQMLEVMEGPGPAALRAIYENSAGGQTVDEKRQANLFVGECLRACYQAAQSQTTSSPL